MSDPSDARIKGAKKEKPPKPVRARNGKPAKPPRDTAVGTIPERVAKLDPYLWGYIHSQSTPSDRRTLLTLHLACTQAYRKFRYLEIGSHRGGSLQALIVDPRCRSIVSIDLRPEATPDDRGKLIQYPGNSTDRMLDCLRKIPDADLEKLQTIDTATSDIDPAMIRREPQLCFIDGEHTHEAALQDARFCRIVMGDSGCVLFHDIDIVARAAAEFLEELRRDGLEVTAYPLPDRLFAIEMGPLSLYRTQAVEVLVAAEHESMDPVALHLARSADDGSKERAAMLDRWLSGDEGRAVRSWIDKRESKRRLGRARHSVIPLRRRNPGK